MKDLKHLIYFENLLEDANNELVRQAQENGSIVLGYTCYHIPEVLLNVDNCISVRLRAPKTGSLDISTYYMSNYTCDYARALVERAIEGGYQFLDAMIGVDACSAMNRSMDAVGTLTTIREVASVESPLTRIDSEETKPSMDSASCRSRSVWARAV